MGMCLGSLHELVKNSQLAVFRGVGSGCRSRKRKMDELGETTNKEKVENESDP
jgi:hypothetical protein